jgi:putative ABC transport system permease protein
VQAAFRDAAGGPGAGKARLRQGLVVAQIALTLVLLTGAGLLLQSFHHLRLVDAGFAHERLLSFRLGLPSRRYPTDESSVAFSTALVARLRTLPGVNDASVATEIPLDGKSWEMSILVEGQPEPPPHLRPIAELSAVEPHYFSVLGIPLRRGRPFTPDDDRRALAGGQNTIPNVVIVDELSARRHWPDADPIGQHLRLPWGPRLTVVGVAGHVKRERLRAEPAPKWQIYVPFGQLPAREISVVVKTALPAEGLAAAARAQVAALDPEQPIYAVHTLAELRDREMAPDRLNLLLVGVFALLALALAVIGLYGVLAYSVVQRRRELAVRLALGARREQVIALVVRQGIRLAVAGLAIGALAAVALTRTLGALLYHVSPTDPLVFAAAITTVSLVALLASYLPARRASQLDPIAILRHE